MEHHINRKPLLSPEIALANEVFDQFCNATTLKSILGQFRHLCDLLKVKPTNFNQFYPKLKSKLRSWKAQALWKKFDQRANHKCYNRGKACLNTRVLIIGGGPCGMRSAIEAQLLGAKVVVVEKRDRMSRNNVLHLWPFVIQDLRSLGAKKFFGKFCAGSIDHISIRQLQCILLKVALILGVEFHESVSFESLVEPPDNQEEGKIGWRVKTTPADHPVSQYEFDVLIGADGKRNTLEGFKRKEFRGKLAIAITANFINKKTEAEARVEEISGVAFIFNQKFFKELYQDTGIDLENIVYYKDDTHYFVMTAKKHSLIDKGVILQDYMDTAKLLAKENVDREALMQYAREAADFSTEYQMSDLEFAVNHYGQPDVAMFDFTSMYAAENASKVIEKKGHRLLMCLVGDSLLEPFWPTGSGCARGFLSSLDACWAIKGWGSNLSPLEVIAERESIYRLLGQTTPENLNRDYAAYTLDPHTRYPNLNTRSVTMAQVISQINTDDPETLKQVPVHTALDLPKKRKRRDTQIHPDTLLHWLQRQVALYDGVRIHDMGISFKNGLALAAIVHRYRPDLIDFGLLNKDDAIGTNQLVFDILEKELGITSIMTGDEMVNCEVPDKLSMFSYLTQIYELFRGEIPHIKHQKLEPENEDRPTFSQKLNQLTPEQKAQLLGRIANKENSSRPRRSRHVNENYVSNVDKKVDAATRRTRKRRSNEKMGASVEERMKRLEDIETNRIERMKKRQHQRRMATQQFYKSMQMLQANAKRDKDEPFEDYSIFLYRQTAPDFKDRVKELEQKILYPDRDAKVHLGHNRGNVDEEFSGRIKNFEEKLKGMTPAEKKPKDLLRAIGKIEKSDWNVKEIEKKIEENKMGRGMRQDKVERVPKWSREQFLARQTKMEKKGKDEPMETDSKYAEIDNTIKNIDKKIKEGNVLGHNKVSAMAEQFSNKNQDTNEGNKVQRSNSKVAIALPAQGGSEMCHFCEKRVYLMERLTAEGKSFHRGCFRCEYCSTSLRIGNHMFDRDKDGGRFYCTQHFGLSGTIKTRVEKKKISLTNKENIPQPFAKINNPDKPKTSLEGVVGLDLLDRGQTPERIEFENLAEISDTEEAHSQMDEDEWTDRNFGPSAAEMCSSDEISDMSDSDDDNEVFEEAVDQPLTTEGTLELAKNWTLRYSHPHPPNTHSDTGSNEYEDSSDDYTSTEEESGTATEDEEDVRAIELRKQEVWLQAPPQISDTETGSETEVKIHNCLNNLSNNELHLINNDNDNSNQNSLIKKSNESSESSFDEKETDDCMNVIQAILDKIEHLNSTDLLYKTDEGNVEILNSEKSELLADSESLPDKLPNKDLILPNTIINSSKNLEITEKDESSYLNTQLLGSNLPDLITSSPKVSIYLSQDSPSEEESFNSVENSLSSSENLNKETTNPKICQSPDLNEEINNVFEKSENNNIDKPLFIVTAATPTAERPPETYLIESSKLAVPKEKNSIPKQKSPSFSSFDILVQELKQRKAKNKEEVQELKLLSTDIAKEKINKYFYSPSKSANNKILSKQNSIDSKIKAKNMGEKVVELEISPRLSNKLEKKDLFKYFEQAKPLNDDSETCNPKKENPDVNLDLNLPKKENFKLDLDNEEFNKISEQSKSITPLLLLRKPKITKDNKANIESKELNPLQSNNQPHLSNFNSNTVQDIKNQNSTTTTLTANVNDEKLTLLEPFTKISLEKSKCNIHSVKNDLKNSLHSDITNNSSISNKKSELPNTLENILADSSQNEKEILETKKIFVNDNKITLNSKPEPKTEKSLNAQKIVPKKPVRRRLSENNKNSSSESATLSSSQPSSPKAKVKNKTNIKKSFSMKLLKNPINLDSFKKRNVSPDVESKSLKSISSNTTTGGSTVSSQIFNNNIELSTDKLNFHNSINSVNSKHSNSKSKKEKCVIS